MITLSMDKKWKNKSLGRYDTEQEAFEAREKYIKENGL